jgi:AraC-like DNA-binding protein
VEEEVRHLAAATDLAEMVARGEAIVRGLLHARPADALDFVTQVDAWLCGGPSPEVADLAAVTGLSQRQIERKCKALYGAPPKLLARKYRALRAAVALVADGATLDDALGRGFYDQSHMIREIKQFTGHTPGQIRSEPGVLAQLTIANRYALGGKVRRIISDT